MRLRNPRFSKYMPNGAGGYTREPHFTLTQECAVCGKMALIRLKDGELISIEHFNLIEDQECPVVKQHNRMGPRANLTFNYGDLEDRMFTAKAALKRENDRISRLDGRTKLGQSSAEEVFEGLTAEPTDAELTDSF